MLTGYKGTRSQKPWTADEEARVAVLLEAGLSYKAVAEAMGGERSAAAIMMRNHKQRLIPARPPGNPPGRRRA